MPPAVRTRNRYESGFRAGLKSTETPKSERRPPPRLRSPRRSAALPDLPTTLELDVPESDYDFWVGMFVPAETPREIVDKLYAETVKAFANSKVKESFTRLGAEPNLMDPRAFDAQIKKEIAINAGLVKAAGIPVAQ